MSEIEYCQRPPQRWNPAWSREETCLQVDQEDVDAWIASTDTSWFPEPEQRATRGSTRSEQLRPEFSRLANEWRRETLTAGHLSKIVMNPAYQRIMAMGPDIIPLILEELTQTPGHWFWALHNLVPEGSDPAEGCTSIREAANAWLEWGRREGFL